MFTNVFTCFKEIMQFTCVTFFTSTFSIFTGHTFISEIHDSAWKQILTKDWKSVGCRIAISQHDNRYIKSTQGSHDPVVKTRQAFKCVVKLLATKELGIKRQYMFFEKQYMKACNPTCVHLMCIDRYWIRYLLESWIHLTCTHKFF